ncbi:hypothetical protein FQZ97_469660 [compost metagenome]
MTATGFAVIWPCAHAHCMTACIRWRVRLAVSGFDSQIGRSASAQSAGRMASSFLLPTLGNTYVSSVLIHCAACLTFFQPGLSSS